MENFVSSRISKNFVYFPENDTHMVTMSGARTYTAVLERLRRVGLRPTRQRLALAKLLFSGEDRHVTAEALHKEALANQICVSLATVYNTLHQFTDAGILREVVVDAARSYFDTNTRHHHHFYREDDQKLVDIPDDHVVLKKLPSPPAGTSISQVDIVVRIRPTST
jgi:Fur family iron response transcriptional regulator